jgi:hypothetical protein
MTEPVDKTIYDLAAAHPGWTIRWASGPIWARPRDAMHAVPHEHPDGWVAEHAERNVSVCASTLAELDAAIWAAPETGHWMHRSNCCFRTWG